MTAGQEPGKASSYAVPGMPWHRTHADVLAAEIATINERRRASNKAREQTDPDSPEFEDVPARVFPPANGHLTADETARMDAPLPVVGLALSGGGIRSAAVCLGVLQALNNYRLLPHIDYLSTVSGGGYIGSAWSAAVAQGDGTFPFGDLAAEKPREELAKDKPTADEVSDTPSVAHIRNYSNFIIPRGFRDLLTGLAIVFRGLAVNIAIVLPFILFVAALTIVSNPTRSLLTVTDVFGFPTGTTPAWKFLVGFTGLGVVVGLLAPWAMNGFKTTLPEWLREFRWHLFGMGVWLSAVFAFATLLSVQNFGVTLAAVLLTLIALAAWGLWRSRKPDGSEFRGYAATAGAIALVLIVVIAFFEAQPFVLAAMFDSYEGNPKDNSFTGAIAGWIKWLTTASASATIIVTFFRDKLAGVLKSDGSSSKGGMAKAVGAKAAIWLGALALPLLIWIGYLHLSMWGIVNDRPPTVQCELAPSKPVCNAAASPIARQAGALGDGFAKLIPAQGAMAGAARALAVVPEQDHVPGWLRNLALLTGGNAALLYFLFGGLLFFVGLFFAPNANSLHRLYRDRLGKAFLFKPTRYNPSREDFTENDTQKLTGLSATAAPYQLIGAALNIQGSNFANRRGRNADFFLFSRNRVGSEATDYVETKHYEPGLDLATAMAISGAAASSNMGAASIRPLTPTLALLNIRLGYWLKNPRHYPRPPAPAEASDPRQEAVPSPPPEAPADVPTSRLDALAKWTPTSSSAAYLFQELSGRLYEDADSVYLTDGGHIENLGIYELLRRRCKVVIAVDAEADPDMHMPSFVTLQRYARIDLGIIIDLPWSPVRGRTLAAMENNAAAQPKNDSQHGPHVSIGRINYGGDHYGHLVYIKSSLSGDENDYIRDYARRFSTFPHEATIEQFFSEEQFEVYRALGFHMTHGWLKPSGDADDIVVADGKTPCALRKFTADIKALNEIRAALRWPPKPAPLPSGDPPAVV